MLLNPNQLKELLNIIENFHIIFIAKHVGTDILSNEDKNILKHSGIDITKFPKIGKIEEAFHFGILADALSSSKAKNLSYSDFKRYLSSTRFIPLTKVERLALNNVKMQSYNDIKGLGNRISSDFTRVMIENDKKKRDKYEKIIKKQSQEAILDRKSVTEFASALGHKTKDWSRDFDRIADYILHDSFDRGKAQSIMSKVGGEAEVYKEVYSGACPSCIKAYLTAGIGGKPKIFKLSVLLNNGSNIGRKQKDWLPVLGMMHPWCRCEVMQKETNETWNVEKKEFNVVRSTYGVQRTSKPTITITE